MDNLEVIQRSPSSEEIKLSNSNLWSEVCTKREDIIFWAEYFSKKNIPFVVAKFDTTVLNSKRQKMYRRVYGIFVDMKNWELEDALH